MRISTAARHALLFKQVSFCARTRDIREPVLRAAALRTMLAMAMPLPAHADHLKLVFPLTWAVTQIAWSIIDGAAILKHGSRDGKTNYDWAMQTLIHGVEFLCKCHYKDDAFVIQVLCPQSTFAQHLLNASAIIADVVFSRIALRSPVCLAYPH